MRICIVFFPFQWIEAWPSMPARTYTRKTAAKTVRENRKSFRDTMSRRSLNSQVSETTQLLLAWADGDPQALDALAPRIYRDLRRMAANFMKGERKGHTLQATALVHEVYLRLIDVQKVPWEGRAHFFAICAQIMRRILVDAARKRSASKHGGGLGRIDLDEVPYLSDEKDTQLIALNDALDQLKESDLRKAKIVELRYFGGLSVEETATVLKVSVETVTRDWRLARGWLLAELSGG
jgi:RNA polymerase sigma factor (TIGR02999 family)